MENTTFDTDVLLETLNNDKAVLMTPVMVILGVLMIMGLVGNALVCFFYTCKSRQSSNTIFIVAMAVYDLILCGISIPIEIVDLRFFYLFTNSGACKLMRFVNYFGAVGSVYTLLVIAVDRYRKICRPFKKQLKLREAKIACGISVIVALVFSWPAVVFYRSVPVDVLTEDGVVLKGYDCTTSRDNSHKVYMWVFNGIYLICFLISSIVLCVMYSLIGRVLFNHNKSRKRYGPRPISSNSNSSGTENHLTELDQAKSNDKHKYTVNEPVESETDAANRRSVLNMVTASNPSTTGNSQNQLDIKTVKYTTMMLVITVVFIFSFLPHLILSLWRTLQSQYEAETLSDAELVAFQIGLRSYFLNSAINPFTYGFFNPKFRQFFYMTFCPCCRRSSESNTISTSSGAT